MSPKIDKINSRGAAVVTVKLDVDTRLAQASIEAFKVLVADAVDEMLVWRRAAEHAEDRARGEKLKGVGARDEARAWKRAYEREYIRYAELKATMERYEGSRIGVPE